MRNIILLSPLLFLLFSCQTKKNEQVAPQKSEVIVFDSTYYFMLKEGYLKKDTVLLNIFFEKWSEQSLGKETDKDNKLAKTLCDIYEQVYQPYDYTKYGWIWGTLPRHRYVVLPAEISYLIINSIDSADAYYETDAISNIFPNPDLRGAKRLLDIDPFKKTMQLFLEKDGYHKLHFLDSCEYINAPISNSWKQYQTTPEVLDIKINGEQNQAIATLRLLSTGLGVELSLVDGNWEIDDVSTLWIE